jgi:hypothetical protein
MSGVIRLDGKTLELLGELEQFRFDFGTNHEADKRPDLAALLAIIICPGFSIRH